MRTTILGVTAALSLGAAARAQEGGGGDADLAKQLANPVSSLISVPFQNNYDCCYGPADGFRYTLNVQPVVPMSISSEWNLIARTILPVIYQDEPVAGQGSEWGLGDVLQSFFFSPKQSVNGITWGVGPAALLPVGSDGFSAEQFGVGPTGVVLRQKGPTTMGVLANHIWGVGGDGTPDDVSSTFVQPFFVYTHPDSTALSLNAEASYDWKAEEWTIPVNVGVAHVYKFGEQRVQLGVFARYYVAGVDGGPDWGLRFNAVLLFPK